MSLFNHTRTNRNSSHQRTKHPEIMIQPQELRLGSVLNYWIEEEKTFVPTRVDWQDLRYISEDPKGFNDSHKPIPLTEEILLKCGFCSNEYKNGYIGIDVKRNVTTDFVLTKPFLMGEFQKLYTWEYRAGGVPFFNQIEHLHQLQNLFFALIGQELQVKF